MLVLTHLHLAPNRRHEILNLLQTAACTLLVQPFCEITVATVSQYDDNISSHTCRCQFSGR